MKFLLVFSSLFISPLVAICQNEQPKAIAETMASTFNLTGDKLTGTCFMVLRDGKQYFVTAAHLFESFHKSGDLVPVQMVVENVLQSFDAHVYFHANKNVDIAVVTLPEKITQHLKVPEEQEKYKEQLQEWYASNGVSTDSIFITEGLDAYFFGYPLGLGEEYFGTKFPLVKKAIISGWTKRNGIDLLLLDGHNNVGFSGGPIVAYNTEKKKMCLVGIMSGYVPESVNVKQKAALSVSTNSGIMICYETRYLEEIFVTNKASLQ